MVFAYLVKYCNIAPTDIGKLTLPQFFAIFNSDTEKKLKPMAYADVLKHVKKERMRMLAEKDNK